MVIPEVAPSGVDHWALVNPMQFKLIDSPKQIGESPVMLTVGFSLTMILAETGFEKQLFNIPTTVYVPACATVMELITGLGLVELKPCGPVQAKFVALLDVDNTKFSPSHKGPL